MSTRPSVRRPAPERVPGVAAGGDEESLLRAIAAAPEDDAVRLVFADWLEEHGRGDQAEFVRLQCQLAASRDVAIEEDMFERQTLLQSRCDAVTPRREGPWRAPVGIEVQRGLPAVINRGPREFADGGAEWLAEAPTTHALLFAARVESTREARAVATADHLSQITRLQLREGATPAALDILLRSPHLANLSDLTMAGGVNLCTRSSLADAHHLTRLARLDLSRCNLDEARAVELLRSPVVSRLSYLAIGCGFSAGGLRSLADCPRLSGLITLKLSYDHRPGATGLEALAASPHLERLRNLSVMRSRAKPPHARALAEAVRRLGVERLNLNHCEMEDKAIREFVAGDALLGLRELHLWHNRLTSAGATALAESAGVAGLRSLFLDGDLDDAAVRAVARSPHLSELRELALRGNCTVAGLKSLQASCVDNLETLHLYFYGADPTLAACEVFGMPENLTIAYALFDAGVAKLAMMPGLARVARLSLCMSGISDPGARALATSPNLHRLVELNLDQNLIGPAGIEVLLAGGLPRLTRLSLNSNPLGDEGLRRIAASPGAGQLSCLGLAVEAGDPGVAALAESRNLANLRTLALNGFDLSYDTVARLVRSPNLPRLARLSIHMRLNPEEFEQLRAEASRYGVTLI